MLRNRSFVFKVVNDNDRVLNAAPKPDPVDPADIVQSVTVAACTVIGFYMATDTMRQILIGRLA